MFRGLQVEKGKETLKKRVEDLERGSGFESHGSMLSVTG